MGIHTVVRRDSELTAEQRSVVESLTGAPIGPQSLCVISVLDRDYRPTVDDLRAYSATLCAAGVDAARAELATARFQVAFSEPP